MCRYWPTTQMQKSWLKWAVCLFLYDCCISLCRQRLGGSSFVCMLLCFRCIALFCHATLCRFSDSLIKISKPQKNQRREECTNYSHVLPGLYSNPETCQIDCCNDWWVEVLLHGGKKPIRAFWKMTRSLVLVRLRTGQAPGEQSWCIPVNRNKKHVRFYIKCIYHSHISLAFPPQPPSDKHINAFLFSVKPQTGIPPQLPACKRNLCDLCRCPHVFHFLHST